MRSALLCQGFQRGFIDSTSGKFSVSASMRRGICEQLLKYARNGGWPVIHIYLDANVFSASEAMSLDGFSPSPTESYFRQRTISAFGCHGLEAKLRSYSLDAVFLISFAGLGAIAGTFLEAMERRIPLHIVTDAVADVAFGGVTEEERLTALSILARSLGRAVRSEDLFSATAVSARQAALSDAGRESFAR